MVNFTGPGTSRPPYYDRNATQIVQTFSGFALAPHSFIQRSAYTVPVNRKAVINNGYAQLMRAVVQGTAGTPFVQVNQFGGPLLIQLGITLNVAGTEASVEFGTGYTIPTGAQIVIADQLDGIGGSVDMAYGYTATEFDA